MRGRGCRQSRSPPVSQSRGFFAALLYQVPVTFRVRPLRSPYASAPQGAGGQRLSSSRSTAATPAGSNRSLASPPSAVLRSAGLILRSLAESNGMPGWRGARGGRAGAGRLLILPLPDDDRIVPEASSDTLFNQQVMQLNQCRHRHARRAHLHPAAGNRIQHPCRGHDGHARRCLEVK